MEVWVAIAVNCGAIALMVMWPRPSHVDDMREMFNISTGPVAQITHRFRRWRRKLPPPARVTTLVIQRAFGPLVLATVTSAAALLVTAWGYLGNGGEVISSAISVASNTLQRLSQNALSIPDAAPIVPTDLPSKVLLASFAFVITAGLVRILQQWLLSIGRTIICVVFRHGAYEVLSGARDRPRLAAVLGVQQHFAVQPRTAN